MDIKLAEDIKAGIQQISIGETAKELFAHQKQAASWMKAIRRGLLLDGVGVGKSIETIGFFSLLAQEEVVKAIIMAPTAVVQQWQDEIATFLDWKVIIPSGPRNRRHNQYAYFNELNEHTILLTNYSTPLTDEEHLLKCDFNTLIVDESLTVSNPETKIYRLVESMVATLDFSFGLTGTPIGLSLENLFHQVKLMRVPNIGTLKDEIEPYLIRKHIATRRGRITRIEGATDFNNFVEKIEPFFLLRNMSDVYGDEDDIPINRERPQLTVKPLPYSQQQRDFFNKLKFDANKAAREGTYKPLEFYQAFLQASSSPSLVTNEVEEPSPKLQYLVDHVRSDETKTVVFVRYLEFLKLCQEHLRVNGIEYRTVSGQENQDGNTTQNIREFTDFDEVKVLFVTGAGKYGLNLQGASRLLFLDVPYNPADFLQLIGRIYRLGQMALTYVIILFMEGTIEEDNFRKQYNNHKTLDEFFDSDIASIFQRDPDYTWGFLEKNY